MCEPDSTRPVKLTLVRDEAMHENLTARDAFQRGSRRILDARLAVLRRTSTLAIGSSLARKAFPGAALGCVLLVVAEGQLTAGAAMSGSAHVSVSLVDAPVAVHSAAPVGGIVAKSVRRSAVKQQQEIPPFLAAPNVTGAARRLALGVSAFADQLDLSGSLRSNGRRSQATSLGRTGSMSDSGRRRDAVLGQHSPAHQAPSDAVAPQLSQKRLAGIKAKLDTWERGAPSSGPDNLLGHQRGSLGLGALPTIEYAPFLSEIADRSLLVTWAAKPKKEVDWGSYPQGEHREIANSLSRPTSGSFGDSFFAEPSHGQDIIAEALVFEPPVAVTANGPLEIARAATAGAGDGFPQRHPGLPPVLPGSFSDLGPSGNLRNRQDLGAEARHYVTLSSLDGSAASASPPLHKDPLAAAIRKVDEIGAFFARQAAAAFSSPGDNQNFSGHVRLGVLVDMLSELFDPEELKRIKASRELEAYVSLADLQAASIPIAVVQELQPTMIAVQSGAAAVDSGNFGGAAGFRYSLAATASTGYDSNPFLSQGGNTAAPSIRLQLVPTLSRSDARNSLRISGRLEHVQYLERYGSLQNFGADLAATHLANERLQLNGGLFVGSNIPATNLANPFFLDDPALGTPVPPTGNDITVLGQRQRRTQFGGDVGLSYQLSPRDEVRWSFSARADRFDSDNLVGSNFFGQQLQYSRQLDDGLSVGAIIDASLIDFTGDRLGQARTVTPQLLVTAAFSPRLEVSASLGVAITKTEIGAFDETGTALAGNLSLCNKGEVSNICITGSRQVLPSAIGGARVQTTGGLSYSLRLSERDTVELGGRYSTASEPIALAGGGDFESINGFARYERQLDERIEFFVSGGYLKTSGNLPQDLSNVQAIVGIKIDLGNAR